MGRIDMKRYVTEFYSAWKVAALIVAVYIGLRLVHDCHCIFLAFCEVLKQHILNLYHCTAEC